jgi:hypothetical protein
MASERLKFRCYRCNQLLAVAPSKAGTVVSCPKCQADLLIPGGENRAKAEVEAPAMAGTEARTTGRTEPRVRREGESRARAEAAAILGTSEAPPKPPPVPAVLKDLTGVLPPDLADLRPEDLRVEAEFFQSLTRAPSPAPSIDPGAWPVTEPVAPSFPPEPVEPSYSVSSMPEAPSEIGSVTESTVATEPVDQGPAAAQSPGPLPSAAAAPATSVAPPIEIEPPSILPPGTEIRRVSQVILPASVVMAWSLFVLFGIALSFIAGLLMGHFLWKTP